MSDYLPEGVWIDIFTRLQVKTLLRCTSVCKSWYSLITSPNFITSHLNRTTSNNDNNGSSPLIITHYTNALDKIKCSVHRNNQSFDECANFDLPIAVTHAKFKILASINGLVLGFYGTVMFLWNPSIRKHLILPNPTIICKSQGSHRDSFGFGFDPLTNDYKVVRVVYRVKNFCYVFPPEVEVYELRTHSWRRGISDGEFSYCIAKHTQQAFLNGAVHWIGYNPKVSVGVFRNSIVLFNMKTESFGTMMVPGSVELEPRLSVTLVGESLSLINTSCFTFSAWVMKKYGVVNSWTKIFEIKLGSLQGPLRFRGNSDVLMAIRNGDLVSYDLESKQISHLGTKRDRKLFYFYVDTYVDSLVLLEGSDRILKRKGTSCCPTSG